MIHEHRKPSYKPSASIFARLMKGPGTAFPHICLGFHYGFLTGEPDPMLVFSNLDIPI